MDYHTGVSGSYMVPIAHPFFFYGILIAVGRQVWYLRGTWRKSRNLQLNTAQCLSHPIYHFSVHSLTDKISLHLQNVRNVAKKRSISDPWQCLTQTSLEPPTGCIEACLARGTCEGEWGGVRLTGLFFTAEIRWTFFVLSGSILTHFHSNCVIDDRQCT